LRAFDAGDADFFLDLLPGPRDRDGLPESLRFWKRRIEETESFAVGVLYGPSGCGKSSLLKAGLLPRLAGHVWAVYVEATPEGTEARLLKGLRRRCPELPPNLGLVESLMHLRRNPASRGSRAAGPAPRVLLVLDQFEQWLHAERAEGDTTLLEALRQCDGQHVQCLFLVRDDFWMAATRFLRDLEIRLLEGENAAAVDLFDLRHARKVLAAFGRAFGALPEGDLTAEQEQFLDRAVTALAQDDKVISVRLTLFAEMVKGKPWTPATLKAAGGAEGVGVTFLEETFSAATAPPAHRLHQQAAQAVLKALLPKRGTGLRGTMRPRSELLAASGHTRRPDDFADLLRILDTELRLVTPCDPLAAGDAPANLEPAGEPPGATAQYYQLTHDYLVPSLSKWLTRKQRQTLRGRAELRLEERAALWAARPENRQLPAAWEWLNIYLFTRRRDWTAAQAQMMRRAARHRAVSAIVSLSAALVVVVWGAWELHGRLKAAALVRLLLEADTTLVPPIVTDLSEYRRWADADLRTRAAAAEPGSRQRLHLALALFPVDPSQAELLIAPLRTATAEELGVLREALQRYSGKLVAAELWALLEKAQTPASERFRAACALAALEPDSPRWAGVGTDVVNHLVRENPLSGGKWTESLRLVGATLVQPLVDVFRDAKRPESERDEATKLLADYAANQPELLVRLLLEAEPQRYAMLWPALQARHELALDLLSKELKRSLTPADYWKDTPPAPNWRPVSSAMAEQVEKADGLVAERFALCQTLPLDQLDALVIALEQHGYRPINVRPYAAGPIVRVAIVWTRDGKEYQLAHDLSKDEVERRNAKERDRGLLPLDVASYVTGPAGKPALVHAVLWARPDADTVDAKLYVGAPESAHNPAWTQGCIWWQWNKVDGFMPRTVMSVAVDGQPRYCGVWTKPAKRREDPSGWDEEEATYEDTLSLNHLALDVRLGWAPRRMVATRCKSLLRLLTTEPTSGLAGFPWAALGQGREHPEAGCVYSWVYQAHSVKFISAEVHGLDLTRHLARCRELTQQGYRPVSVSVVEGQAVAAASVWHRPVVPEEDKEVLAKRQAQAAVTLLQLGHGEHVWPLLEAEGKPDLRLRTWIIHKLSPLGSSPRALVQRLDTERTDAGNAAICRALVLALGEFSATQLPAEEREALAPRLLQIYRDHTDPGLHSAVEWLLRRWRRDKDLARLDQELKSTGPRDLRRWYVTEQGHTLARVPSPETFWMGSPSAESGREPSELLHRRRIPRAFVLATKEVTVAQYRRFLKAHPEVRRPHTERYSEGPDGPILEVTWYEAAQYCRWLSELEEVPEKEMCYPPIRDIRENMTLPADCLARTGYRLPTEAEWEYACRTGTETSRHYGAANELLEKYAWYSGNSQNRAWPVAQLKPNDWGFFDLYGNAREWCATVSRLYRPTTADNYIEDQEYDLIVRDAPGAERAVRGGVFHGLPEHVRSAVPALGWPGTPNVLTGFRVARTIR
jgi:formylglycine-generating enzyme required for sulfatase activity